MALPNLHFLSQSQNWYVRMSTRLGRFDFGTELKITPQNFMQWFGKFYRAGLLKSHMVSFIVSYGFLVISLQILCSFFAIYLRLLCGFFAVSLWFLCDFFTVFLQFPFQILRAYFWFQHNIAKMGPFPLKSRGSGVPLHAVRNLAPFGPLDKNALENHVFTMKKWVFIGSWVQILNFPN